MKHNISSFLRSIVSVLHNDVAPQVSQAYPRHRLELAEAILLRLIADLETDHQRAYLGAFAESFDGRPADLPSSLRGVVGQALAARNHPEAPIDDIKGQLVAALSASFEPLSPASASLDSVVHAVANAEYLVRQRTEKTVGALRLETAQARTSSEELVVSEATLSDYLRRRTPERKNVRAANVRPVPGGRSKGTILFDLIDGDDTRQLVIRKDFAKNFMGCSVADEYPIVRAAWENGVLALHPLWLEQDPTIIGGKFIVFERAAGNAVGTMFDISAPPALIRQYAGEMAKLHAVDPLQAGIADTLQYARSDFPVKQMILDSYEKHQRGTAEDLLLESAHVWMLNNLETVEHGAALVHGDAGFHNVLGEGDRMTAILDWELAHAGDPAEDLMKCKAASSQIIPWPEFMDIYVAHGGRKLTAARERFFTIWRMVSFSMFAADARRMFDSGEDLDLRLAAVGYNTFPRLHEQLARELAEAPR